MHVQLIRLPLGIHNNKYIRRGGEDASEDLVQELSIPELQAITKYRILRNALMQSEQIWGYVLP